LLTCSTVHVCVFFILTFDMIYDGTSFMLEGEYVTWCIFRLKILVAFNRSFLIVGCV